MSVSAMTSRRGPASGLTAYSLVFACCTSTTPTALCPRVCCWFGSRRRLVRREGSFSSACCLHRAPLFVTLLFLNCTGACTGAPSRDPRPSRVPLCFLRLRLGESILISGSSSSLSVFGSIGGPVWDMHMDMDMDITLRSTSTSHGGTPPASMRRAAVEAMGIGSLSVCTLKWSLDALCVGRLPPLSAACRASNT